MSVFRLIINEILHRKLGFVLGLAAVTVATGCLVAAVALLKVYDEATSTLLNAKQTELTAQLETMRADVAARGKALQDEMRRITLRMGFNVVIMPEGQNLTDLFAEDYAAKFMDESLAEKLANSNIVTINHLLPSLEQRVQWPERGGRTMILVGTRGEVPLAHRDPKKPLVDPVAEGQIILGNELARSENIREGDQIEFMETTLAVAKIYPQRGDKRDITAWIDLGQAQTLLDKEGLINSIWALECKCAFADLPKVRSEIQKILPNTTVMEKQTIALARAEARQKAEQESQEALAQAEQNVQQTLDRERNARQELRQQRESVAGAVVPAVVLVCAFWIALLMFINVQQRKDEIGVLRAIGVRSSQILALFLVKACCWGLVGAVLGIVIGLAAGVTGGARLEGLALNFEQATRIVPLSTLGIVLLSAPLAAALAGWLPSYSAAQQDPASVLRGS